MNLPAGDGISVRHGHASDAEALAGFAARAFELAFGAQNDPADVAAHAAEVYTADAMGRDLADANVTTLIAERDGAMLGYSQLRAGDPPACVGEAHALEIQRFYVDPALHGTGFASSLMAATLDAARARGARHAWLGVWERNPRAIAFYAKHGFADVGSKVYVVGSDPQTDRVMRLALTDTRHL